MASPSTRLKSAARKAIRNESHSADKTRSVATVSRIWTKPTSAPRASSAAIGISTMIESIVIVIPAETPKPGIGEGARRERLRMRAYRGL